MSVTKQLLLLNGLAIVGVILFHSAGWGFVALFAWAGRYLPVASPDYSQAGSVAYFGLRLIEQAMVFSIPGFLCVTGFFVAFSTGEARSKSVLSRAWGRIRILIVPYVIWSAIIIFGLYLQDRHLDLVALLGMLLTGASNPAYYFVPLLIQLYLLGPLLVRIGRASPGLLLAGTGALQVVLYLVQYPILLRPDLPVVRLLALLTPKWLVFAYLFWFSLGIALRLHLPRLRAAVENRRGLILAAIPLTFAAGVVEWELLRRWSGQPWIDTRSTLIDGMYSGVVLLGLLFFLTRLPSWLTRYIAGIGSRSYGIYLVHVPVMEVVARGVYHFAPPVLGFPALFLPLLVVAGLGAPLIGMALVRRSPLRPMYPYLFG
jgi:surface polysaccharide O-acyltransferase-like enzyme